MKIALVAPQYEAIPPVGYGGTELVVANIIKGLMVRRHDVTVYASGDSKTKAKVKAVAPEAIWKCKREESPNLYQTLELDMVREDADKYDIIHNHIDYNFFILTRFIKTPVVTTFHGPVNRKDQIEIYKRFARNGHYVSISDDQRKDAPKLPWAGTVYNGIDMSLYGLAKKPKRDYLLWLGRADVIKGPDLAVKIAKKFGMKLKLICRVNPNEEEFFNKEVKPYIDGKKVEFIGEISLKEKVKLYQNAYATLMPNRWREPFGLVMTESMACGTPVVGTLLGSIPEIIEEGKVGFMGKNVTEMAKKLKGVEGIIPQDCYDRVQKLFSIDAMAEGYLGVYERALRKGKD